MVNTENILNAIKVIRNLKIVNFILILLKITLKSIFCIIIAPLLFLCILAGVIIGMEYMSYFIYIICPQIPFWIRVTVGIILVLLIMKLNKKNKDNMDRD